MACNIVINEDYKLLVQLSHLFHYLIYRPEAELVAAKDGDSTEVTVKGASPAGLYTVRCPVGPWL